jgi:hypothetical protein
MQLRGFLVFVVPAFALAQFPSRQSHGVLRTGTLGGKTIRYVVAEGQALAGDIQLGRVAVR